MNFRLIMPAVFSLVFAVCEAASPIPYEEALEKAKEQKKEIVVLSNGTDWLPGAEKTTEAYQKLIDSSPDLSAKVIWAVHEVGAGVPTEEDRKKPQPPMTIWYYPGLQVTDSEGRPLAYTDKWLNEKITEAPGMIRNALETRKKRDVFWSRAREAQGVAAAELISKGFDFLPEKTVGKYRKELDWMKKEDPEDVKGYYLRHTFDFVHFHEKDIQENFKEKNYAQAYKNADQKLKLPALKPYQRQVILNGKFRTAREEGKMEEALNYLRRSITLAPGTDFSKGTSRMIHYYTQPVKLDGLSWNTYDNRPYWAKMNVDVRDKIRQSGTYEIEFKHRDGHTRFRNPVLRSGKTEIASVKNDQENSKFTLTVPKAPPSRITLEVESHGTGWFAGKGDIIITKK